MIDWWRKHTRVRKIVTICSGVCIFVIGFQLVYPKDLTLPFTRLDNRPVGMIREDKVAKLVGAGYSDARIATTIRDKIVTTPLKETGLKIDFKKINNQLTEYPWYWRVVPFSSAILGLNRSVSVEHYIDQKEFTAYADKLSKRCLVVPKNAGVVIENDEVRLSRAASGSKCEASNLTKQFMSVRLSGKETEVTILPTDVQPKRLDKDVQDVLDEARGLVEHEITLSVVGKTYKIDKEKLVSWLLFSEDSKTDKLTVSISPDSVKAYLETIRKEAQIEPGTTVVSLRDGMEVSRTRGATGRKLDKTTTAKDLIKKITTGGGELQATTTVLSPNLKYVRSYSKTPKGLQVLLDDLVKGRDMAISVRRLGDSGVSANGDKKYHPASTYKLLVAYSVLKRIDAGSLDWGQAASGGQSVVQCFDKMIVLSDNLCAEWFGGTAIGWSVVRDEARALGLKNTSLVRPFISTANDQALFLQKLESNQLGLSKESHAKLIDAMKRQVFRKGIPAGVGVTVADKVGFLEGLLHDSAIVYSPNGVYVIAIYSNGSSWGTIADAARRIHMQLQ